MIDFACKEFRLDDVIKCALGLTKADVKVLRHMVANEEWYDSQAIASDLDLDLSTVQRSLKRLSDKGALLRSQSNLDSGGYVFSYKIKPRQKMKELIMDIVDNWRDTVEKSLEKW